MQPHIVACRASHPCTHTVMQKIAMFSNVPMRRVFSMHDRPSIYTIPDAMRRGGIDREILSILDLHDRVDPTVEDEARDNWATYTRALSSPKSRLTRVGLIGKYASLRDAYASIDKSLEHCGAHLGTDLRVEWVESAEVDSSNVASRLEGLDAVIVPGGFGSRGVEGKIACVRHCRETGLPYLGICLGFQVAVIEYARHVLGLEGATSAEFDPDAAEAVISELPDQKRIEKLGGTMRLGGQDVKIRPGTLAHALFGRRELVRQRFRHRYEVEPEHIDRLEAAGLIFSGRHPAQPIMQILELPDTGEHAHPYFVAAQFHPELTGRPLRPQPMFMGLIASAIRRQDPSADLGAWASLLTRATVGTKGSPQLC